MVHGDLEKCWQQTLRKKGMQQAMRMFWQLGTIPMKRCRGARNFCPEIPQAA